MVPIYGDMALLSENAASGQSIIKGDFTDRRFFVGGRVVVVPLANERGDIQDNETDALGTIHVTTLQQKIGDNEFQLADNLPTTYLANCAVVFPLICVHPKMSISIEQHHCRVWQVKLEFEEKKGPTALPPASDDIPPGFDVYRDIPILQPDHDYTSPLQITLLREGRQFDLGRDKETILRGDFPRYKHRIRFNEYRARGWQYIQFFDTRRGRLRPFWLVDQENVMEVLDLQTNFIDVRQVGDFDEFQEDMEFFGFTMKDGTTYVARDRQHPGRRHRVASHRRRRAAVRSRLRRRGPLWPRTPLPQPVRLFH